MTSLVPPHPECRYTVLTDDSIGYLIYDVGLVHAVGWDPDDGVVVLASSSPVDGDPGGSAPVLHSGSARAGLSFFATRGEAAAEAVQLQSIHDAHPQVAS